MTMPGIACLEKKRWESRFCVVTIWSFVSDDMLQTKHRMLQMSGDQRDNAMEHILTRWDTSMDLDAMVLIQKIISHT